MTTTAPTGDAVRGDAHAASPHVAHAVALDAATLDRLADALAAIVGARFVRRRPSELRVFDADGLPGLHRLPALAVLPGTRDETIAVVRLLAEWGVPFVPRGAGTGLSGGALADAGAVLVGLNRLTRVLAVHPDDALAVVEPGVVNATLARTLAPLGLHYAPDPSSQAACTIGGNVAENAGGPHCLKYGVTLNHVVAATVLLPDGTLVGLGDADGEDAGYDLLGAFVGSEGCFGIALDVTIRLTRDPEAVRTLLADFASLEDAARAVSAIVAAGIVPAAMEVMDAPAIAAVEASIYAAGYPTDCAAVLLCELDGLAAGLDADAARVDALCRAHGARGVVAARDAAERLRLWQGRKKAFGAMGRLAPSLVLQDAVVPRTQLPAVLAEIGAIGARHGVRVANFFHAGDGNLHPTIPYDAHDPDESARVHAAMGEVMAACIAAGGTITGEHGVGLDKQAYMDRLFDPPTLDAMCRLRDAFDPARRANPGKVVPIHACTEWRAAGTAASRGDGRALPNATSRGRA